MPNEQYHFDEECLIIAYNDDQFAGIFVAHPDETFTKRELLSIFRESNPTYLIAAKLPEMDNVTPENYLSKLSHLIEKLSVNDQTDLDVEFYIPRTLH